MFGDLSGPVYTPTEFSKRRFHSENRSNVFRPHYVVRRRNITSHFKFVFQENSVREITWLVSFQNDFRAHENGKPGGVFQFVRFEEWRFRKSLFSWWSSVDGRPNHRNKAVFSGDRLVWTVGLTVEIKLCFRDGLVWTQGQNVETKLRFPISPV